MRYPVMRLCCLLLIHGGLLSSVDAGTSQERVALSLSGPDCSSQRQSIIAALGKISGVGHVDLTSVPDHALVDIAHGAIAPQELSAAAARSITPGRLCRIEIMKSCISASLSPSDH
jgi:hypothetical protein